MPYSERSDFEKMSTGELETLPDGELSRLLCSLAQMEDVTPYADTIRKILKIIHRRAADEPITQEDRELYDRLVRDWRQKTQWE